MKKVLFSGFLFLILILSFQNCSQKFQSQGLSIQQSLLGSSNPLPPSPPIIPTKEYIKIDVPSAPHAKLSDSAAFTLLNSASSDYANFMVYEPQYPLYSDEADKKRWIYLPEGTQVNTDEPDRWEFPTGTILYKEFSLDGKKVETRVLEKMSDGFGPSYWRASVYLWKKDQSDADLFLKDDFYSAPVPEQDIYEARAVEAKYKFANVNQCNTCHSGARDTALGFSYLQLSDTFKDVNVLGLGMAGWLTKPPSSVDQIPGSAADKAAIGYIQGNCAHCHNGETALVNFKHLSTMTDLKSEAIIVSDGTQTNLIEPGSPSTSRIFMRFTGQNGLSRMPPIGSNIVDPIGEKLLNDWITGFTTP